MTATPTPHAAAVSPATAAAVGPPVAAVAAPVALEHLLSGAASPASPGASDSARATGWVGSGPRMSARAAWQEVLRGTAVLVDVRPRARRRAEGSVTDAVVAAPAELAGVAAGGTPVLLLCSDGVAAGRAAAALRRLGVPDAAAITGGVAAWRAAGLPIERSHAG